MIIAPATTGPCRMEMVLVPTAKGHLTTPKMEEALAPTRAGRSLKNTSTSVLHGLTGRGIGRYGTSGLADASVKADGALNLVRSYQGLVTIE